MSRYYKKNRGSDTLSNILNALGVAIVSLFKWLWSLIVGKKRKQFDKEKNQQRWYEIEKLLDTGDEIHAQQAVIRADKYIDGIMREAGAKGDKFADRLRSLELTMSHESYQGIWDAHKLRNQISHEVDHKTTVSDCKQALSKYRRGLQGLGAI